MDHKKPLTLSIIIPAYNEERQIKACLDAIAAQTEMPDEVLLVDNNSTDATVQIANQYSFITVIHEKKQGIVFARNAGFNAATGDILGRIDTDTIMPKNWVAKVKRFYAVPAHHDHALTGGGYFYNVSFPPRAVGGWIHSQLALRFNRFIMGHYILWGSNMALTRQQWDTVKELTCRDTDIHEDLDLAIHLHRLGHKITYRSKLRVGVKMRRMFDNYSSLHGNLLWWPRTLKRHNIKRWVFGWIGAYGLLAISPLLIIANLPVKLLRGK